MPSRLLDRVFRAVAIVVWLFAVGTGLGILLRYSNTPGAPATPPTTWPNDTTMHRTEGRATLLVFVHPQCSCSEASIEELSRIVTEARNKLQVYVLFYAPEQQSGGWVRGRLWQNALMVPGLRPIEDRNGVEVRRFRAATSGQTLLYDAAGHLRFNGGITESRGHSGSNDGRDTILALARNGYSQRATTPVFGCSLLGGL